MASNPAAETLSYVRRTAFMRRAVFALIAFVVLPAAGCSDLRKPIYNPEVEVQSDEYGRVRRDFRTSLTREGPAPQEGVPPTPPDYVNEVEYQSGALHLKAWISGHRQGGGGLPAVLFLHGGFSFGAADWDMAVPYWEAGYVVMVPMLRGENGQPGTFSLFYDEVDDVLAAADYLSAQSFVDPSRIFIAGHSSGATLALLSLEASPRFRAGATFDGSPDQQLLYHGKASKPGPHKEIVFDPANLRELQVRSPLAFVNSLKSPTRMYYSSEASSIIREPSRRMAKLANARGVDVEAVGVRGTHMSHVAPAMKQSIRFFNSTLGATEPLLEHRTAPPIKPSSKGNTEFTLRGFPDAKRVSVAGSFNGWDWEHVLCGKETSRWICRVNLPPGKYEYQFVVDDNWIVDPDNPIKRIGENQTMVSILDKK